MTFLLLVCAVMSAAILSQTRSVRLAAANAAAPSEKSERLDRLVVDVQRHFRNTNSFSAKFQEEIQPVGGITRLRQGTVYYSKGGRMRWNFSSPNGETIVSDGRVLYTFQPDLNQVLESPIARVFQSSAPVSFLLGIGRLDEDFTVSVPQHVTNDGMVHLRLVPKGSDDVVEMSLEPKTYGLKSLKITDALGNVTKFTFSDGVLNVPLDAAIFRFREPQGVDIVKAPGMP